MKAEREIKIWEFSICENEKQNKCLLAFNRDVYIGWTPYFFKKLDLDYAKAILRICRGCMDWLRLWI